MTGLLSFFAPSLTDRQSLTKRNLGALGLLLVAIPLSVWALGSAPPEALAKPPVSARPVESVSPQLVSSYTTAHGFTGRIEAERSVDLGFQLAGELAQVAVKLILI